MNSHLSRDNSEDEPKKTVDYKLDDFEMVKTIGTGITSSRFELLQILFNWSHKMLGQSLCGQMYP